MEQTGARSSCRACATRTWAPSLVDFSSGYFQRALDMLPKQGTKKPWKLHQNYLRDIVAMKFESIEDDAMEFSR